MIIFEKPPPEQIKFSTNLSATIDFSSMEFQRIDKKCLLIENSLSVTTFSWLIGKIAFWQMSVFWLFKLVQNTIYNVPVAINFYITTFLHKPLLKQFWMFKGIIPVRIGDVIFSGFIFCHVHWLCYMFKLVHFPFVSHNICNGITCGIQW